MSKLEFFSYDDVIKFACDCYDVEERDFRSRCREQTIAEARFMAMYVLYDSVHMKISEIARLLGREHCTVIYGIRKMRGLLETDETARLNHDIILESCRASLRKAELDEAVLIEESLE